MTTPSDTPTPIQEAVAAARAEIVARGEPDPFTGETVDPAPSGQEESTEVLVEEDQATESVEEQDQEVLGTPEAGADEEGNELFVDLEIEEEAPAEALPDSFELPGIDEAVSLEELKNGYLRQADYTRKTQEVARDKELNAKALEMYQALVSNPKGFAHQLAVAAGFIEQGDQPIKVVDLPFTPQEEVDAEIERRVEAALAEHPDVVAAQDIVTERWIESEFAAIEEEIGRTLGPKSREMVLRRAVEKETDDLRMVFNDLMALQTKQSRAKDQLKKSAPVKPTGSPTSKVPTEPETPVDAALLAAQSLGIELDVDKLNFK